MAQVALLVVALGLAAGTFALRWPEGKKLPMPFAMAGFFVAVNVAALAAWYKALRGERNPVWEPTRRPDGATVSGPS
jgi:hypothetical protein